MAKYKIKVIETLERRVTVNAETTEEAVADVQEQYDNEDIVLDWNDLAATEIVPEWTCTVVLYHVQKEPDDVESWLAEHYKNFDSNCSWFVTHKEVEHVYNTSD